MLPRHMQIIYLINWLHLEGVTKRGEISREKLASISLISEGAEKRVRMAHLAFVEVRMSSTGALALHTELLKKTIFHDLAR